ncbi:plastocyanin/azurin family copper-binding protein [Halosimplex amylolyticum]|uniref:plastocyanin/azurin family copper-binding protein n=1 Tax=Halosimplex amylolyticum TaxID=3396616 RepID=UPI003F5755E6
MDTPTPTRRQVIEAGGAAVLATLAGCSTSTASDGATSVPTTEDDGHHAETNTHHDESADHEDGHDHEHGGLPTEPAASVTVEMRTTDDGTHFDPHVVWVEEGGTVTWNLTSGTHTATAYAPANDRPRRIPDGANAFDSGTMTEQGATFEHTFETEGVYDYCCVPHEATGMIASVVVGEPDPHGQPGMAQPHDEVPETAQTKLRDLNAKANEMLGHSHDETSTDDGHHDETATEHHDDDGHHDETATEHHDDDGHHDETATEHHDG